MFNRLSLAIFLAALVTSGYFRWHARRGEAIARTQERGWLVALRAMVSLPLFVAVLIGGIAPTWMAWASIELPDWLRWIGVALGLATIPAVCWVLGSLGTNVSETVLTKRTHQLVTIGPYRWIRHPLYTTGLGFFAALGLMQASWLVLAVAALAAVLIRWVVIPIEEQQLVAKFDERYRSYMRRTGRLLPRLSGAPPQSSD